MDAQQSTRSNAWGFLQTLAAMLILGAITWLLYGPACSGWWHDDDAAHLFFVMRHGQIWQYFAVPEVSRAASEASLVPWAFMIYRIVYVLFGMTRPYAAYVLQLCSLMAVAWMTMLVLSLWTRPVWAWLGALLFLLGAPVMHAANEFMTIHYVHGLLFTLLAAYGFVRAVRSRSWWSAIGGGFCYLIAATAKEVFLPLPFVLLFIPEGTWRQRGLKALPFLVVLAFYLPWRVFMLGTLVGGYQPNAVNYDVFPIVKSLLHIPALLLGSDWPGRGVLIIGLLGMAFLIGWHRQRVLFALVALAALLGPLVPLTLFPGIVAPERYLFTIWWAMTAGAVLILERLSGKTRWRMLLALALWTSLSLTTGRVMLREQRKIRPWLDLFEIQGRFLWDAAGDRIFLIRPPFHVARFVAAIKQASEGTAPIVIDDPADLEIQARLGLVDRAACSNATIWAYDETERRMRNITEEFRAQSDAARRQVVETPLRIDLQFVQHYIQWHLGPYEQGCYLLVRLTGDRVLDRIHFLPRGRRDGTGGGVFDFFFRYNSPEGWTTYSPVLRFDRKKGNIQWQRE